jgi:enoyl-CoA hydratase/carnithine racemase
LPEHDTKGAAQLSSIEIDLETIRLEWPSPRIAVATLNRPDRLNAMTVRMFGELEALADALDADDDVRVLIMTGAGKAFCAGYDLDDAHELPHLAPMEMLERQEHAARALLAIRTMRIPVIAAVNGAAAGGGFSLALAADIRLASAAAKFNAAMTRIGLSAGDLGISWLLPRIVGPALAAELAYTGRFIFADEAERTGLVNQVTEPEELLDASIALAEQICANSPGGVQLSKRALQANMEITSYAAALELENRGQALLTRTSDMTEALEAFKQKRAPVFTGK